MLNFSKNNQPSLIKSDWKKDVVYLYQFHRSPTVPNLSPFCVKIETWLRVHKLAHEVIGSYFNRSQNGLVPFVEINGRQIADSQLILFELQKHFGIKEAESPGRVGISRIVDRMIEGSTFYALQYTRICKNTAQFLEKRNFGREIPAILRTMAVPYFRNRLKTRIDSQGYGKFAEVDVEEILRRDIAALDSLLGDNKFYGGGDQPCTADVTVFGHLATCEYIAMDQPVKALIGREFPRVKAHIERMRKTFWPDWDTLDR